MANLLGWYSKKYDTPSPLMKDKLSFVHFEVTLLCKKNQAGSTCVLFFKSHNNNNNVAMQILQ